ncbi:MAG: di-trans,poly-cis-decaprenylcistransferase, partial [Clostridia bacterium]|nr:di-trans,poly-cis-decaprenylcistransferase [Clostridia bacterium]
TAYKLPNHICFIIDGNGRWAKNHHLPRSQGHIKGLEKLQKMYKMVREIGIKYVSIYAFSTENWNRPKEEVDGLMKLTRKAIKDFNNDKKYHDTHIDFLGDISKFDKDIVDGITSIRERTKNNTSFYINVCLNYGGREDIVQSVNKLIASGKTQVTIDDISANLYTSNSPDPDFIVRTSGEHRLSNFMPWQSIYAELYFPNVLWPDFGKNDLIEAIKEYSSRDRRFGAIK